MGGSLIRINHDCVVGEFIEMPAHSMMECGCGKDGSVDAGAGSGSAAGICALGCDMAWS